MFRGKMNLLVALVALVPLALGCSSDDGPTGTGGGGGGGGDKDLAAGVYTVSFDVIACPPAAAGDEAAGGGPLVFTQVLCDATSFEEFLDLGCSGVTVTGDNLSVDCTYTEVSGGGTCTTTYRIVANGTKTGNTWNITGTQTITSEVPADCSGDLPCEQAMITVEITSTGAPTACQYADGNTVQNTVQGGPIPGNYRMDGGGASTAGQNGGWLWNFGGFYDLNDQVSPNTSSAANQSFINFSTPEVRVADLPATFALAAGDLGASKAGEAAFVGFSEFTTAGSSFFVTTVDQGTITVNEVSADLIAGTYTAQVTGTQFTPPSSTTTGNRTLTGGYHIRSDGGFTAVSFHETSNNPTWQGWRHAMKTR